MVDRSVVTFVDEGRENSDHLSLDTTEWARAVHQLHVEFVMQADDARMHAVDLQDVVVVIDLMLSPNFIGRNVVDVCHILQPMVWVLRTICGQVRRLRRAQARLPERTSRYLD